MRISIIMDIVTLVCLIGSFIFIFRSLSIHRRAIKAANTELIRFQILADICTSILPEPNKIIYNDIKFMPADKIPKNDNDSIMLVKDTSIKMYNNCMKKICYLIDNTDDLIQKNKLNEMKSELEGIFNLLSTIDENSSQEYKVDIIRNLEMSLDKIMRLNS